MIDKGNDNDDNGVLLLMRIRTARRHEISPPLTSDALERRHFDEIENERTTVYSSCNLITRRLSSCRHEQHSALNPGLLGGSAKYLPLFGFSALLHRLGDWFSNYITGSSQEPYIVCLHD
jgi:hypothetical protein